VAHPLIKRSVVAIVLAGGLTANCAPTQELAGPSKTPASPSLQNEKANPTDPIEALAGKWDFKCGDKGCVMFTDVLIGDPDHLADPNHPEYITIGVAINRSDRKPEFFSFDVPADADRKQGLIIVFAKTVKDGKSWKSVPNDSTMSQLDFNSCDEESCVARVHAEILSPDGSPGIDLLDKFLNMNHIYFIYTKKGKPYRALAALFPFQRDYRHLMETELKAPTQ
jgi:hypothetical protein